MLDAKHTSANIAGVFRSYECTVSSFCAENTTSVGPAKHRPSTVRDPQVRDALYGINRCW